MRKTNILCFLCLAVALGQACQNAAPKKAEAPNFTSTPYWVSSSFVDRLAEDSLNYAGCAQIFFFGQDSMSYNDAHDGTVGAYTVIDDKTIEYNGNIIGMGEAVEVLGKTQVSDQEISVVNKANGSELRFKAVETSGYKIDGVSLLVGRYFAGTYTRSGNANTTVTLHADGTVKGFEDYQHFEVPFSGDVASFFDGHYIYFSSKGQEYPFSWTKSGDTLNLWTVKNLSGPNEMPSYEVVKLYDRLIKKK